MKKDMTKEKVVITETVTRYPAGGRRWSEKANLSWQHIGDETGMSWNEFDVFGSS